MATILLFAKEPVPGRVKTRLVPPLRPAEAADLAAAFLVDLARTLERVNDTVLEIALPPGDSRAAVEALLGPGCGMVDQGTGDLGDRLAGTVERAFGRRDGPVAVVGSDHPHLPAGLVDAALREARRGRAGWIPTRDGGYACLALPRPLPGLFTGVPWSTPRVAEATLANARTLGIPLARVGGWYDVDDIDDLHRLAQDLGNGPDCPATRRVLAALDPPLASRTDRGGTGS